MPLTPITAVVDEAGINAPDYMTTLSWTQDQYRTIYGEDLYLEADAQDGQFMSLLSSGYNDANGMAVAVYNNFSPATAIGAGLSSVVKVNGISRKVPTTGSVIVTLIGQAGAIINDGVVGDGLNLGTSWNLPPVVTIPNTGEVTVTAICADAGAIRAEPNTITVIRNPQPGWQSVTNPGSATVGAPVETDPQLRQRQSRSAAMPAQTTLNGIYAAVAAVPGVTRAEVYENDNNATNAEGIPGHNIAVVTEGGDAYDIATAIGIKKPPGIPTHGTVVVDWIDPRGVPSTIKFTPLTALQTKVLIFLTPLGGYVSSTVPYIQIAVSSHLTNLNIGAWSYLSRMYPPADLIGSETEQATGLTQAQCLQLTKTYKLDYIAQSTSLMRAIGGYGPGANSVNMVDISSFEVDRMIFIDLDDLSHYQARVTAIVPNVGYGTVSFTPALPPGKNILAGASIYLCDDVKVKYDSAFYADPVDITIVQAF